MGGFRRLTSLNLHLLVGSMGRIDVMVLSIHSEVPRSEFSVVSGVWNHLTSELALREGNLFGQH